MGEAALISGSGPDSGHATGAHHRVRFRVYYEDTDSGGVVYHANYLKFAERGRTEFLRLLGVNQDAMRETLGVGFMVRRCGIDFRRTARLDDVLEVRTRLTELRGARLLADQHLHRIEGARADEDWLVRLDLELACVGAAGKPVRLPAALRHTIVDALTISAPRPG